MVHGPKFGLFAKTEPDVEDDKKRDSDDGDNYEDSCDEQDVEEPDDEATETDLEVEIVRRSKKMNDKKRKAPSKPCAVALRNKRKRRRNPRSHLNE